MDFLLTWYWSAISTASTISSWGGHHVPGTQSVFDVGSGGPTTCDVNLMCDLELVCVAYEFLSGQSSCARCGAALHPAIEVDMARQLFARARIVAATHCQGPARHRHRATVVVERGGDLRLGPLSPG